MAKINNSDVIQKLVDELQLYPGKDIVPSELAEKILPVFQINSDEIVVNQEPANIVRNDEVVGVGTSTLYTTSANNQFYLTSISMYAYAYESGAGDITGQGKVHVTIDGSVQEIATAKVTCKSGVNGSQTAVYGMSFINPIKVDKSTNIVLEGYAATGQVNATITGYEED